VTLDRGTALPGQARAPAPSLALILAVSHFFDPACSEVVIALWLV
jgi:hypothetical protein